MSLSLFENNDSSKNRLSSFEKLGEGRVRVKIWRRKDKGGKEKDLLVFGKIKER